MMVKKPGEKYGCPFVRPHWVSSSCSARTILTPFSSAFTPIASPSPPGRIASGRLPAWVAFPLTVSLSQRNGAETRQIASGLGGQVGSVTMAPSARKPASTQAVVPS
jgi:hypothetical protein